MLNLTLFGLLGLIWGSSFLLIKIGVRELDAFSLVAGRMSIAALAFGILLLLSRQVVARKASDLLKLAIVGLLNSALPFVLIAWSEQWLDSSLAGVLNATTPLFSLIIAHFALADDRITASKLFGLIIGFFGVIVLALRSADPRHDNPLLAQLAVLGAGFCYASAAVFVRRYLRGSTPIAVAGSSSIFGALLIVPITLLVVNPLPNLSALSAQVALAVIMLGLINTFLAYLIYYRILAAWGASRATMVTYIVPPISVFVGVVFGNERLDLFLLIGAALILSGILFANRAQIQAALSAQRNINVPAGD
ncbi:MAG: DMT family transporter [Chloroflexota bacterium]|jgi:drug/metabolite transporter (DMT)-like permease|nr:MAG: DMT family transporter [Chloroflexota bacterium]